MVLKKQILSLPVSHKSFFGEEFSKASDTIIKEQATLDKIIKKKSTNSYNKNYYPSNNQKFRSSQKFFRGRGKCSNRFPRQRRSHGGPFRGSSFRGGKQSWNSNYSPQQQQTKPTSQ